MALKIIWSKRADKKFDKIIDYLNEDKTIYLLDFFDNRQDPKKKRF